MFGEEMNGEVSEEFLEECRENFDASEMYCTVVKQSVSINKDNVEINEICF